MKARILATYHQIHETINDGSIKSLIRKRIFWQRIATPVEMDLTTITPTQDLSLEPGYSFTEIIISNLQERRYSFAVPSRNYKAYQNLHSEYRCFAIVKDSTVLGDIWCITPLDSSNIVNHPDLRMLGIKCRKGQAYAFDMFLDPTYRGKNLAVPLQRHLHCSLKTDGIKKVYGFYWDDNIPALWMHRMLKFTELPKRRVTRFFFLYHATFFNQNKTDTQLKRKP